jgi:hypothetical protein
VEDRLLSALVDLFDLTDLNETEEDGLARFCYDRRTTLL